MVTDIKVLETALSGTAEKTHKRTWGVPAEGHLCGTLESKEKINSTSQKFLITWGIAPGIMLNQKSQRV